MIRSFLSFCLRFLKSRIQLQLEIVYLRKQLEIPARSSARPRFRPSDRFFFSILANVFSSWKTTLLIIKPGTVIRWHQQGFKLYWRWKGRSALGRPKIPQAQILDFGEVQMLHSATHGVTNEFLVKSNLASRRHALIEEPMMVFLARMDF